MSPQEAAGMTGNIHVPSGAAGTRRHVTRQGECVSSIAKNAGFFWETVRNRPENAELKRKRKDPNVLFPGDVVFIPAKCEKKAVGATEQRHRFRKLGEPAMLRLRLLDGDKPRANEPYALDIDGTLFSGVTDEDGRLEHAMPPNAKAAGLLVGQGQAADEYTINLGDVDPIDQISGVQARLSNMEFDCGAVDGALGPKTTAALKAFQRKYELTESGEADSATREKLLDLHGC